MEESDMLLVHDFLLLLTVPLFIFGAIYIWHYISTQVNCWFCNTNTGVPFSQRKRFFCPNCEQYNGFAKDGGYDRVIEEQHREAPGSGNGSPAARNGLCAPCNRNQEMRVRHLANFEPLRAADYDREVEHFEKQLEKSFGLCGACDALVKSTIRHQNAWIFGNVLRSSSKVHRPVRRTFSPLAALLLLLALGSWGCFCGLLPEAVPLPPYLQELVEDVAPLLLITSLGFTVEGLLGRSPNLLLKLNKLLAWGVLGLTAAAPFAPSAALYRDTLQVFCSLYLSYAYGSACLTTPRQKRKKKRRDGEAQPRQPQRLSPQPRKLPPELNEHFNGLNIGPPMPPKVRPISPNPFAGCDYRAGGDAHVMERPTRTLLSPSRLDHVTAYPDASFVIGQMRTRYVSGFYGDGPFWTPVYTAKAHYF